MNVSPSLRNSDLFCELKKKLRFVKKNQICLYVYEKKKKKGFVEKNQIRFDVDKEIRFRLKNVRSVFV